MITVLPLKDKNEVENLFSKHGVPFNGDSGAVIAECNGEMLGYCIFYLDKEKMTVIEIEPKDDIMLFDGILRSALHNAVCAKVMKAVYLSSSPIEQFEKLSFILDAEEKTLDINKLFKSSCECGNKNT